MRVGIITFHFVSNQGGVLQAYASQTFLEKNGHEAFIINYRPKYHVNRYAAVKNPFIYSAWYWKKFSNIKLLRRIQLTIRSFGRCLAMNMKRSDSEMESLFDAFIKKNLHETKLYTTFNKLKEDPPLFDAYISGSDQLWSPDLLDREFDAAYFLLFGEKIPKITYAVSTGRELTDEERTQIKALSKELTAISMREYNEATITDIGKDVHICIDPTLLLDAEDYASVESDIIEMEPYIFVYGFENSAGLYDALQLAIEKYHCKVINGCPHRIKLGDLATTLRNYGPDRFLTLIKNAECVVTNSFHGTAFSVIYKKDFITVTHSTRGGRMTSLLYQLGLTSRLWGSVDFDFSGVPDFEKVEKRRSVLRKNSSDFLLSAIEGKAGENIPHIPEEYTIPKIDFKGLRKSTRYKNLNKSISEKSLPELYDESNHCCGCSACYSTCPVRAISMEPDEEGFLYPMVDATKCVRCYRCLSVCAFKVDQEAKGYLVRENAVDG